MGLISSLILGGLLYAGSGAMAQDMPGRSKPKALDVPKAKSSGSLKPDVEVHAGYEFCDALKFGNRNSGINFRTDENAGVGEPTPNEVFSGEGDGLLNVGATLLWDLYPSKVKELELGIRASFLTGSGTYDGTAYAEQNGFVDYNQPMAGSLAMDAAYSGFDVSLLLRKGIDIDENDKIRLGAGIGYYSLSGDIDYEAHVDSTTQGVRFTSDTTGSADLDVNGIYGNVAVGWEHAFGKDDKWKFALAARYNIATEEDVEFGKLNTNSDKTISGGGFNIAENNLAGNGDILNGTFDRSGPALEARLLREF